MNLLTRRLALVLGCCWSVSASAGLLSDDENKAPPKEESALVLPAPPKSAWKKVVRDMQVRADSSPVAAAACCADEKTSHKAASHALCHCRCP